MRITNGPLASVSVVEIASLGPVPFAGMVLADLGAEVLRIDRTGESYEGNWRAGMTDPRGDVMGRGKKSLRINLKRPEGLSIAKKLISEADIVMEGLRPGSVDRLGLGRNDLLDLNSHLIFASASGWGRDGSLSHLAGHDINYLALSGVLGSIGPAEAPPVPPMNYLADFGAGGCLLVAGICAALFEREKSGYGQVVDHSMLDGSILLTAMIHGMIHTGQWNPERVTNELDGAAPYYRCYATSDDKYVAAGAIEPKFYEAFLNGVGLDPTQWPQADRSRWPFLHTVLEERFRTRSREEWTVHFRDIDACVSPVLSLIEAAENPMLQSVGSFTTVEGVRQPGVTPRFSRTPGSIHGSPPIPGEHTDNILNELGHSAKEINRLRAIGVVE